MYQKRLWQWRSEEKMFQVNYVTSIYGSLSLKNFFLNRWLMAAANEKHSDRFLFRCNSERWKLNFFSFSYLQSDEWRASRQLGRHHHVCRPIGLARTRHRTLPNIRHCTRLLGNDCISLFIFWILYLNNYFHCRPRWMIIEGFFRLPSVRGRWPSAWLIRPARLSLWVGFSFNRKNSKAEKKIDQDRKRQWRGATRTILEAIFTCPAVFWRRKKNNRGVPFFGPKNYCNSPLSFFETAGAKRTFTWRGKREIIVNPHNQPLLLVFTTLK